MPVTELLRSPSLVENRPLAPGNLPIHYSPRTPVVLRRDLPSETPTQRAALLTFRSTDDDAHFATTVVLGKGELAAAGRELFAVLRELDAAGYDMIVVDECEEEGLGRAIMDRLRRAAGNA